MKLSLKTIKQTHCTWQAWNWVWHPVLFQSFLFFTLSGFLIWKCKWERGHFESWVKSCWWGKLRDLEVEEAVSDFQLCTQSRIPCFHNQLAHGDVTSHTAHVETWPELLLFHLPHKKVAESKYLLGDFSPFMSLTCFPTMHRKCHDLYFITTNDSDCLPLGFAPLINTVI